MRGQGGVRRTPHLSPETVLLSFTFHDRSAICMMVDNDFVLFLLEGTSQADWQAPPMMMMTSLARHLYKLYCLEGGNANGKAYAHDRSYQLP
jgi:hypothetical protein